MDASLPTGSTKRRRSTEMNRVTGVAVWLVR